MYYELVLSVDGEKKSQEKKRKGKERQQQSWVKVKFCLSSNKRPLGLSILSMFLLPCSGSSFLFSSPASAWIWDTTDSSSLTPILHLSWSVWRERMSYKGQESWQRCSVHFKDKRYSWKKRGPTPSQKRPNRLQQNASNHKTLLWPTEQKLMR